MWLIIGAGYVGERVADLAILDGIDVCAVTASQESAAELRNHKPYPVFAADVCDRESLRNLKATIPQEPTHVLLCASSGRGGVAAYERVFVNGITHLRALFPESKLVFTSSSSVYPQVDGSVVTELSEANPSTLTAKFLREAEELVFQSGGLVVRLAGIYGPNRSHPLKQFLAQKAAIEGNQGLGKYLNQIHRDDAAAALVHLMKLDLSGCFNVSDDHPFTQLEFFQELSSRFSSPVPPSTEVIPQRKRAWTHKKVSNAKLLATGFLCRYPNFFAALDGDSDLLPSIQAQLDSES